MLTGLHPYQNEVWTNSHVLDSGIPTLAHAMGAANYRPIIIGRMHFVGPDQLHGYAERLVGDHGPNYIGGGDAGHGVLDGTAGPDRISLVSLSQRASRPIRCMMNMWWRRQWIPVNRFGVQKKAGWHARPL